MKRYLERYLDGECEVVWQELVDLGEATFKPSLLAEATAVVEEIVRRLIHNANIVGNFLAEAGYEFDAPGPFVILADEKTAEGVREIEREYGELPLILKVWWSQVDHLNLRQSDSQYDSGMGCHTQGISPSTDILLNSPEACLKQSRMRAENMHKNNALRIASGESPEILPDPDAPFLVLGPCASSNDDVGFLLPVFGVDAHCDNEGLNWTLVEFLRNAFLSKGGLRWAHFGQVRQPDGELRFEAVVRETDEIEAIVKSMNLEIF